MRNALIAIGLVAATAAPSLAQSVGPEPWMTQRPGTLAGPNNRDSIRPQNDREIPDSQRIDNSPVGSFGNPAPGPVYVEPAPGYGPQPGDPIYPDYPEQ